MKKRFYLTILIIIGFNNFISAGIIDTTKIYSKPLFLIYSNFQQGISKSDMTSNFDVKRAYLGYDFYLDNGFSGFIKIDIRPPDASSNYSLIKRKAYLRNVGVAFNKNNLKINFGIINNQQHSFQEKFWEKRYIFQTYINEYDFLPSTDLGINLEYKLNNKIALEAGMMSGEHLSYKANILEYIYNIGITYCPNNKLNFKLHSSYTKLNNDQITSGLFIGIVPFKKLKLGASFNGQLDIKSNSEYIKYGYSSFATFSFTDAINIFVRCEQLMSNTPRNHYIPFNFINDGKRLIGGVEYIYNSNLRLSINYQDWHPSPLNQNNNYEAYIFLNVQFGIHESHKRI